MSRMYHGLSSVAPVRSLFVLVRSSESSTSRETRCMWQGADMGVARSVARVPIDRGCARTPMPRAMRRPRIGLRGMSAKAG